MKAVRGQLLLLEVYGYLSYQDSDALVFLHTVTCSHSVG